MRQRKVTAKATEQARAPQRRVAVRGMNMHAVLFSVALQSLTFYHAHGFAQEVPLTGPLEQLCLHQVHESGLQGFEPIGLSVEEASGPYPTITMWSRTGLRVMRLSPTEPAVESTFSIAVPGITAFTAALTDWRDGKPVVEYIDLSTEAVREIVFAAGGAESAGTPIVKGSKGIEVTLSGGAMRTRNGWALAQRIIDPLADTSAIFLSVPHVPTPAGNSAVPTALGASADATATLHRRIDRILHVRSSADEGVLVTEAAFPFTTIGFTPQGTERWRVSPQPDELRNQLGEVDLRYVMATPAVAVGGAVLNTLVALRSGRRVSVLWTRGSTSARYREIPGDVSFLGA